MPIAQRTIEPTLVYQSRGLIENSAVAPSLPSTSLVALTAIIRQLSAISKYADEMFGDVFNEASKFVYRSNMLEERVAALSQVMAEKRQDQTIVIKDMMPPPVEKPRQHILNVYIPRALKEKYHACDRPPQLGAFARLRTDNRDGLTLYTDPTIFFRQWLYNMNREANVLRNPNKKRLRRSRSSMRAGNAPVLYVPPPSASPPPPLPYPVYENREPEKPPLPPQPTQPPLQQHDDNIYEMLPEQIDDCSPIPGQHSSPIPHNNSAAYHHTSIQYNSGPQNNSGPQHSGPQSPFHRNASYDLSMQCNQFSPPPHQFDSPGGSPLVETDNLQRVLPPVPPHVAPDSMLSLRSSLTSLSLDAYPPKNRSEIEQAPATVWEEPTNHLQAEPVQHRQSFNSEGDVPFSLDDLPPPPDELLDTLDDAPYPVSTTPYKAAPPSPQDYYDSLPVRNNNIPEQRYEQPGSSVPAYVPHSSFGSVPHSSFGSVPHSSFGSVPTQVPYTPDNSQLSRTPDAKVRLTSENSNDPAQDDLMAAIRAGINLRPAKKADVTPSPPQNVMMHDVASILQRRKFLIGDMCDGASESSQESEGEWDDEDDTWN